MSLKDTAREVEDTVKNYGRKAKDLAGALTGRAQVARAILRFNLSLLKKWPGYRFQLAQFGAGAR